MRLEFEPNASALPYVEKEAASQQNSSFEVEKMLREGVKAAQEGNRAEARKMLLQVTETDADNENAWLWLASISEYPEELLVFLNNVLRVNPNNERALEWHKATKSLLAKTLVQRGVDAAGEDRKGFARQCFEQAVEHEAENETAWLWMAAVADSDEEKTACFEKVLSINPGNSDAKASLESIQSQKTQKMFEDALAAAFDGKHAEAHEMLDAVLERDGEMEDAWVLKSHIAASFEERAECFLKLRALNPENEMANANLASWRTLADKLPKHEEAAEEVAEQEASFADLKEEVSAESESENQPAAFDEQETAYLDQNVGQEAMFDEVSGETEANQAVETAESSYEEFQNTTVNFEAETSQDILEEFSKLQNDLTTELEETEMHWAFNETAGRGEAEDFFRDLDESDDIHRTQTQESFDANFEAENPAQEFSGETESAEANHAEFSLEAAEDAPTEEWRNTSPGVFVNYSPETPENSFAANVFEFSTETEFSAEETPVAEEEVAAAEEESFEMMTEMSAMEEEKANAPEMFAEYNYLHQFTDTDEESLTVEENVEYKEAAEEMLAGPFEEQVEEEASKEVEEAFEAPSMQFDEAVAPQPQEEFPHPKQEMMLCPFCNAENEKQAFSCGSCRTILTLSDLEMLLGQHSADVERLVAAIESLESENESYGLNAEQLANLGVGHINLKNYRQGFHYLQEAVRLNPNNVILDAQVNALAIRLTEIEEQQTVHDAMAKNRKILVVDDSPTVRKLISGKLEKCGHEVICAVDGLDALQKIGELTPDLILLDITMPRMDGYQVCKLIRSNDATKDVPVVMISGKDGFFDKVRGRMAGTTGYITKPFGPETLMKTVETYL